MNLFQEKEGEYGRLIYEIEAMKIGDMKEVDRKAVDILFSTRLLLPFIITLSLTVHTKPSNALKRLYEEEV